MRAMSKPTLALLFLLLPALLALSGCSDYSDVMNQQMKSGATFSGRLKSDSFARPDGAGTMIYADKSNYSGHWQRGVYEGDGHYTHPDGVDYHGVFKNGEPWQVSGKMHFPDGSWYNGNWDRTSGRGQGTIWWPDGRYYTGDWLLLGDNRGLPDGEGELIYPDGTRYRGSFRNGKPYGLGNSLGTREIRGLQ